MDKICKKMTDITAGEIFKYCNEYYIMGIDRHALCMSDGSIIDTTVLNSRVVEMK